MASLASIHQHEDRAEPRDEVYHRSRVTLDNDQLVPVVIVNLSPNGMMARTQAEIAVGERLKIRLPVVGIVCATVRWSLGGRIGCQFDRVIEPSQYHPLLAATAG